jgi:poly(3-hydroxybutyrate) depolymerase
MFHAALVSSMAFSFRPSPGCGSNPDFFPGTTTEHSLYISNTDLMPVNRVFQVRVPENTAPQIATPLLFLLHGQHGTAASQQAAYASYYPSFVVVTPQGMHDTSPGGRDCGTGWNTGANGEAAGCDSRVDSETCCYASCAKLGKCTTESTKCSWSSCYDDADFVANLLDHVSERMCIDLDTVGE